MSSSVSATDGEVMTTNSKTSKNIFDDEDELDYEEEVDFGKQSAVGMSGHDNGEEEEGEISDEDEAVGNVQKKDRDEGELDDEDDLEEGEVKEDGEIESEDEGKVSSPSVPVTASNGRVRITAPDNKEDSNNTPNDERRRDFQRNNSYHQNRGNYGGRMPSRYDRGPPSFPDPRGGGFPQLSHMPPSVPHFPHQPPPVADSWERGLKQVRELLTKKRKQSDTELEPSKRYSLTSVDGKPINPMAAGIPPDVGYRSRRSPLLPPPPDEKRRRLSGVSPPPPANDGSSSEDEVERRHRLAFDAAPWNSGNRNRNTYFANRSSGGGADTYRDPWMRSRSPNRVHSRSRRDMDAISGSPPKGPDGVLVDRYGNPIGRPPKRSLPSEGPRRGSSSISSPDSAGASPVGRRLPYDRPTLSSKSRHDRDREPDYRRMDRIPKKSNAGMSKRGSEDKSYDSWSDPLSSETDSSSSFSDSDDHDDSPRGGAGKVGSRSRSKRLTSTQATKRGRDSPSRSLASPEYPKTRSSSSSSYSYDRAGGRNAKSSIDIVKESRPRMSRYDMEKEAIEKQQQPIKMTFLKTKTNIQKDRLIDERLNGDLSDEDDIEDSGCRRNNHNDDGSNAGSRGSFDCANNNSLTEGQLGSVDEGTEREQLLLKLRNIEEAIERKILASKRE